VGAFNNTVHYLNAFGDASFIPSLPFTKITDALYFSPSRTFCRSIHISIFRLLLTLIDPTAMPIADFHRQALAHAPGAPQLQNRGPAKPAVLLGIAM